MDLDVKESGNVCTLKLKGKLIIGEPVDQFESAFQSALASGHVYLIVDLEEVPFLDSCGIGAIVNSLRLSTKAGGKSLLVNPGSFVAKTLKMVGVLDLFGVFETEAEAMTACAGS